MSSVQNILSHLDSRPILSILVIATGASLAILWLITYFLWRSSQRQYRTLADIAQTTASAARHTAENIAIVERAYVHPIIVKDNIAVAVKAVTEQRDRNSHWPSVQFKFKNYGKSAAVLTDIKAALVCWTGKPISSQDFEQFFPGEASIQPGQETETFSAWVRIPLGAVDAEQVKKGAARLYFYGQVDFDDIWGEHRIMGFYQSWDFARGKFVPDQPDVTQHVS